MANRSRNVIILRPDQPGGNRQSIPTRFRLVQSIGEKFMSEENAPEEKTEMPSAGKQIMVMAIIVVGITVVLGGGVMLSMWLQ